MKCGNVQQAEIRDICLSLDGHQSTSNNFQDKITLAIAVLLLLSSDSRQTFVLYLQAMVIEKRVTLLSNVG